MKIREVLLLNVFIFTRLTAQKLTVNYFTLEQQQENFRIKLKQCEENKVSYTKQAEVECPIHFDGAVCWPASKPDSTVVVKCPSYVNFFNYSANASRDCLEGGIWRYNNNTNKPIVNYTGCIPDLPDIVDDLNDENGQPPVISSLVQEHLGQIRIIYTVGYSVSVVSLCFALILMLLLRRLYCSRNAIHMNLFGSFILRGVIHLIHDYAVPQAAHRQTTQDVNDITSMNLDTGTWFCKMITTLWMYARLSNCVWIFIEGFYLHMLIFINTFSDKSSIKWFITCGWGCPLFFVIPWVVVRIKSDDMGCWTIYMNRDFRWIIEAPIVLLIIVNFIFFVTIIILLFTKLRATETSSRAIRIYRKLAKSTLVLIPLFGVHYIVFLFEGFFKGSNETVEVIRFYFDTFFTSFQGLMVSILFCFLNGEVRKEVYKKWKRWQSQNTAFSSIPQSTVMSLGGKYRSRASITSDIDNISRRKSSCVSPQPCILEEGHRLLGCDLNQNRGKLSLSSTSSMYMRTEEETSLTKLSTSDSIPSSL